MKNQNAPPTPLQHPSTRPSSVEGGEANTCKLTECQGKPRCEKCLTMDRAPGMASTASFLPCSFCNTADACKVSGCVDAKIGRAIAAGERAASGVQACGSNGTADCQSTPAEQRCAACPHQKPRAGCLMCEQSICDECAPHGVTGRFQQAIPPHTPPIPEEPQSPTTTGGEKT